MIGREETRPFAREVAVLTPDFAVHPPAAIRKAELVPLGIRVEFADGQVGEYHSLTLRENAPDGLHPETREQSVMLTDLPADLQVKDARPVKGGLAVKFSDRDDWVDFHGGWLRSLALAGADLPSVPQRLWNHDTPPAMDCDDPRRSDESRLELVKHLLADGVALLTGLPIAEHTIIDVASTLGPLRDTNFGRIFDVRVKAGADSNAYTDMALPVHTDLSTREAQPGFQFLFCMASTVDGAETLLVDGAAIADHLRQHYPQEHDVLTSRPLLSANRSPHSDYRYSGPVITYDEAGQLACIRVNPWLRAPCVGDLTSVDEMYRALRVLFNCTQDTRWQIRLTLRPGMMLVFDNRRTLHGRTAFDGTSGSRWLRGCYVDREEVESQYRVLTRG